MAVEHKFAPKNLPLGNLPYNTPGTTFTGSADGAKWKEFLRGDMPQIVGRNRVVALANGHKVWENELRDSDTPHRNEAWRGDNAEQGVYFPGERMCCYLGLWLPLDFPVPPAWSVFWQIHTPYDYPTQAPSYASPMTLISGDTGKFRVQDNAEGGVMFTCDYDRGRWHYWGFDVVFGRPGRLKVLHALDHVPAPGDTPVFDAAVNTCIPNHSTRTGEYTKNGLYMAAGTGKTYVHRRDGYMQCGTLQRTYDRYVAEVCNPDMVGTTPPPPPPDPDPWIEAMEAEWQQFMLNRPGARGQWTQDQRWRFDNPGQLSKLIDYRNGGAEPDLGPDGTGPRMVDHITGERLAKGTLP